MAEWTEVYIGAMGTNSYRYLKVKGGWLVWVGSTKGEGLAFVPDPTHENPPEPLD